MNTLHYILCGALLLPAVGQADAADRSSDWQFHGFLTQGFVKTDHNRFFGPSDKGSFEFTEIGVNASTRPLPELLLSAQLLSRKAGAMYNGTPAIDFAVARWDFMGQDSYRAGLSLGRLKNPIGLYNSTRDVAHTRPSIFLPQSIYFDKARNLEHSSDGIMLHLDRFGESQLLSLDMGLGQLLMDDNVEAAYLGQDWRGNLETDKISRIAQLRYATLDEQWRFALSYADGHMKFKPGPGDPLSAGKTQFRFIVGSVQYNTASWTLSAEYAREPLKQQGYGPLIDSKGTAESYYLQLQHYLNDSVTLHARYEEAFIDKDDHSGRKAAAAFGIPAYFRYTKSLTLGARWNITPSTMLSADYSFNRGTYLLSSQDNPNPANLRKNWNMFALLFSYRF